MALSSLFILMTEHGLEYPNLYVKLYALLEPSLLDSCLKSPLLPAYLAASFAKKLSRLALTVPPSGGLEDNVETAKDVSSIKSGIDQFKNDETDLLKTNAMIKFVSIEFSVGN
ncbi:nucleolar complex protein 4 homolog B [Tanacetum coccineum]